mmetsp:Transcript_19005/g.26586  ORF Transcript_19005/g.26586 Transcript_19005/m.26586 type:complete len:413 (+) Transcript_19005:66-1304(+)|eukprot:CAMPEP_0168573952 /NCGR_PEP_ID=MMETSP0413-20121227/18812_1 /TAXON_ID=136452 /ORGANISM="Filamoeba nolandi, Strain NC-AS-23-1" /LENGTH=412 /DNA_ID=CAMNT_0008607243 /DNA_START=40 /DNA_END=1278 /DNA_ORIENTATION=+
MNPAYSSDEYDEDIQDEEMDVDSMVTQVLDEILRGELSQEEFEESLFQDGTPKPSEAFHGNSEAYYSYLHEEYSKQMNKLLEQEKAKRESKTKQKLYKVVFMGHKQSGKTSLINQYIHHKFSPQYKCTIGGDFLKKDISIDGVIYPFQFWDTAGQMRFQSLATHFYQGADCCVLVFDVGSEASFNNLNLWRDFFWRASKAPQMKFILIGNKTDQPHIISKIKAEAWCKANGDIPYIEASAKDPELTEKTFEQIVRIVVDESRPLQALPPLLETLPTDEFSPIIQRRSIAQSVDKEGMPRTPTVSPQKVQEVPITNPVLPPEPLPTVQPQAKTQSLPPVVSQAPSKVSLVVQQIQQEKEESKAAVTTKAAAPSQEAQQDKREEQRRGWGVVGGALAVLSVVAAVAVAFYWKKK